MEPSRRGLGFQKCKVCDCIHQVVIYKEGCSYRVEPGRLPVHRQATVTFFSLVPDLRRGEASVALWFPKGTANSGPIDLKFQKPTHVQVGNEYGAFAYAVHVLGAQRSDFAEGGSPPRIIVTDP